MFSVGSYVISAYSSKSASAISINYLSTESGKEETSGTTGRDRLARTMSPEFFLAALAFLRLPVSGDGASNSLAGIIVVELSLDSVFILFNN